MRWFRLFAAVTLTCLLLFIGGLHQPFGSKIPALGPFLSPFTGFWQQAEAVDGKGDQQLRLEGLQGSVEVVFDDRRVPHIFAENTLDVFFVQGYLHAHDRLWQMDISVRSAAGRLAEVVGQAALETDRLQRRKGMLWAARNTLADWANSPEDMAKVNAYAAGVNAYLKTLRPRDYPLEFKLLGYAPEEWTPLKSALFFKKMAETLCFRYRDLEATNTRGLLGEELFDFLYPEYNPQQSPVIPETVEWNFTPLTVEEATPASMISEVPPYDPLPQSPDIVGSNNWAVGGSKTASGHPILCGDPHLGLSLPSIWYEVQLHAPDVNAYGVSFPSVPGIFIGFNENTAWSVTNVGHDVVDWYRIIWANEDKTRYLLDGQTKEVTIVEELIKVKGEESVIEKVKYTHWGPVVYESEETRYHDMAMRWLAHDRPPVRDGYELGAFWGLMRSRTYDDYLQALEYFELPPQNFAFADRSGDIAMTVRGKFPLKRKEQGRFIQDGSRSGNDWQGFIPYAQVPRVRNPERGFVSSANQHSTALNYPYYYNGRFEQYRGRYINRRLEAMEKVTPEDMKRLQTDTYSLKAEEGVPLLLSLLNTEALPEEAAALLPLLREWDFRYTADSRAAVLFEEWLSAAFQATFDEQRAAADSTRIIYPETWRFLDLLRNHGDHAVFDDRNTPVTEQAGDMVTQAYLEAVAAYGSNLLDDGYDWAAHQRVHIDHMAGIPAFSWTDIEAGGCGDAVNALKSNFGPSWRMIVDLGDEITAWGIFPGGASGNPGSPFYDNAIADWAEGNYYKLFFMKDSRDDRQDIRSRLTVKPKS